MRSFQFYNPKISSVKFSDFPEFFKMFFFPYIFGRNVLVNKNKFSGLKTDFSGF